MVVDLEATCWGGNPPPGEVSDIIEIGLCELNLATLTIERPEGVLIKPSRSTISHFCTSLTSISEQTLKGAKDFNSAMNYIVNKYSPQRRIWTAWGEFDRIRLQSECTEKGATFPFGPKFINAKSLFSVFYGYTKEKGLAKALKASELQFDGTPHRGVDDARNTARLLARMIERIR
jgi:inhibitor of KinA sporulation pathway (predicted exonuclease)